MRRCLLLLLVCCMSGIMQGQGVQIVGGERFSQQALPGELTIAMNIGESREFILEENIASGYIWIVRPQNPALQTLVTHQGQVGTGNMVVPMGTAIVKVMGTFAIDMPMDIVLANPADVNRAPLAVIRGRVVVVAPLLPPQQNPVVIAGPNLPPPGPGPLPSAQRVLELSRDHYYKFNELHENCVISIRKNTLGVDFYLECNYNGGCEWIAVQKHDRLSISVDSDSEDEAFCTGHKHKRKIHGARFSISGDEPCDERIVLEYRRQRAHPKERPIKVVHLLVKVR